MVILTLKWLHIVSAIVLFGTGLGTAFFKFTADRSGDLRAMAVTNRHVVLADWLFTMPGILIQPLSGYALAILSGYPLNSPWLLASLGLYLLAGLCWLPVVRLQIRMRDDGLIALATGTPLNPRYRRDARMWFWLGVPAFAAMLAVTWLMVVKPVW